MGDRRDAVADVLGDESPLADLAAVTGRTPKRTKEAEPEIQQPEQKPTVVKPPVIDRTRRKRARKPAAEPLGRAKRMKVSIEEERTIDELVARLAREVGTKVQFSHVARAMWSLLLESEGSLERVNAPSLHRPENGNLEALAEFEADLADYLLEVFQATPLRRR